MLKTIQPSEQRDRVTGKKPASRRWKKEGSGIENSSPQRPIGFDRGHGNR